MWATRICIGNPVFTTMLMLAFVVLGAFSYTRMAVDQFPEVSFPVIVIQTDYPGAPPQTVETDISRKIEEAVNSVSGIRGITSKSMESSSVVIAEFDLTVDVSTAAQEVREKIAIVRPTLRREIKEPRVSRYDPADRPILSLGLQGKAGAAAGDLTSLTDIADRVVRRRLERIPGVGQVGIVGGARREIQIQIKPDKLSAYSIGIDEVAAAIRNTNVDLPAGTLRSDSVEHTILIKGRADSPEHLGAIIVASRNAQLVRIADVAEVVDASEEPVSLARYNGVRTVALDVLKTRGQNTLAIVDQARLVIDELNLELAQQYPGVSIGVIKDGAQPIRVSVNNVQRTLGEGAMLTVLIVFLFLGSWRSTVITGLTLPVAIFGTFFFMHLFGFTINVITLIALNLSVGLLIDDAIVVRENIVRHAGLLGTGANHRVAAIKGTKEIALAVMATTFSIVAVFFPVGFMGGIIGRFFHQFGITVVVAVLLSMLIAFTLDPMLSSVWPEPAASSQGWLGRMWQRVFTVVSNGTDALAGRYKRWLARALRHRAATVAVAVLALAAGIAIPAAKLIGTEFIPAADYGEVGVIVTTPVGSSMEFTDKKIGQIERALRENPDITSTYASVNSGATLGRNRALILVQLVERGARGESYADVVSAMRARLASIGGISVVHVGPVDGVGSDIKQIRVSLQGPSLATLGQLAERVQASARRIPGLVDLESSLIDGRPGFAVAMRGPQGGDARITPAYIANTLYPLFAGDPVSSFQAPNGELYDVSVRLPSGERNSLEDLNQLMLTKPGLAPDGAGGLVALREVVQITATVTPFQFNRRALSREIELSANASGRSVGEVNAELRRVLAQTDLPAGYRYEFRGSEKNSRESTVYAVQALLLGVAFIYMILASQFKSFTQPLAIMAALPLTVVGAFSTLWLFGSTLNLFSIIGLLMLMGLVTKNAILLIDYANLMRLIGMSREAALLEAAGVRFRPILMTTLAMIVGMLPLAYSVSDGAEHRAPIGQAVIGGVIASSILTLVVVPVVYTYLEDLGGWLARRIAGRKEVATHSA